MKKLKHMTITEKEFRHIKSKYIRFYKNENRCSDRCPMGLGIGNPIPKITKTLADKRVGDAGDGLCFCHQFKEFNAPGCPCNAYGQEAFVRLEKLVKRLFID